jgi:hypothetical protein
MDCFAMTRAVQTFIGRSHYGLLAFLLLFSVMSSRALGAETFMTVSDVAVDVTAKSAVAARDQAIAAAQRKAFDRLLARLVPNPADQARIKPSQEEVESFVQDFAVQSERSSSVRYIGVYTVRFRTGRLRKYLSDIGVNGITDVQQVLVVPVYVKPDGALLWERGNDWRAAWERGALGDGPVTLILPNGDAFDTGTLSAAAARSGDSGAFDMMLRRYHATGVVVATAESRGASGAISITAIPYDSTGAKGTQTFTVEPVAGEQSDRTLLRGVALVAEGLEGAWRRSIETNGSIGLSKPLASPVDPSDSIADPSAPGTVYPILMPVSAIGDWVRARDFLSGIGGMHRVSLDALTHGNAAITLEFAGDVLALQGALAGSGYVLVQTAPGNAAGPGLFELRRVGMARPPAMTSQ